MEKHIKQAVMLGGALVVTLAAAPAALAESCDGTSGTATYSTHASGDLNGLIEVNTVTINCSANVKLNYTTDTNGKDVFVRAGNKKGMHTFGGSSLGGSVKNCEPTASLATPHTDADALTAGSDGCS